MYMQRSVAATVLLIWVVAGDRQSFTMLGVAAECYEQLLPYTFQAKENQIAVQPAEYHRLSQPFSLVSHR